MTETKDQMQEREELRQAWLRGKPAELDRTPRPPSSVLSLRLPTEVLKELTDRAKQEGKSAGALARELIEGALAAQRPMTPASLAKAFSRWVDEGVHLMPDVHWTITEVSRALVQRSWLSTWATLSGSDHPHTVHRFCSERRSAAVPTSSTPTAPASREAKVA